MPQAQNAVGSGDVPPLASMEEGQRSQQAEGVPLRPTRDHWREIFNRYDVDNDNKISLSELKTIVNSVEYKKDIPKHVIKQIMRRADLDGNGTLDFEEFVNMVEHPDFEPFFQHLMHRYVYTLIPQRPRRLDVSELDGLYEDEYRCCPPPVCMILISLIEIVLYCVDAAQSNTTTATGPVAVAMIYDPKRRYEAWRYVSYMFVHIGVFHLIVNLAVQIMLGTPLEMVHRWWRVVLIYLAGVVAGSLGTSITDPSVKLAGASGGVYALIAAHISTIIMNWKEMEFALLQLLVFLIISAVDIGTAIYNRYYLDENDHIGYAAHFAGAIAGLLVGINILRNLNVTKTEKIIWWVSIVLYCLLMGTAIVWNIAYKDYFPPQSYET